MALGMAESIKKDRLKTKQEEASLDREFFVDSKFDNYGLNAKELSTKQKILATTIGGVIGFAAEFALDYGSTSPDLAMQYGLAVAGLSAVVTHGLVKSFYPNIKLVSKQIKEATCIYRAERQTAKCEILNDVFKLKSMEQIADQDEVESVDKITTIENDSEMGL